MRYPTQRLDDRSAERNVGHEVPVHHIHVNAAGSGLLCLSYLFTQPSEVGSKYRRSQLNPVFYHFRVFPSTFMNVGSTTWLSRASDPRPAWTTFRRYSASASCLPRFRAGSFGPPLPS